MTLKQLEAFYWAAQCANFSSAAEHLHLSISSLSKRIVELEESLGVRLFDRSGHRAHLTDAGQSLFPRSLELLDAAASIRNAVGAEGTLAGRCCFGIGELSALTWLPGFISQARKLYPKLLLEPYVDVGSVLEHRLMKGELDFAIIAGRSTDQSILSQSIASAQFLWMASPLIHEAAPTPSKAISQGFPLVTLPPGAGTSRIIDDWLMASHLTSVERINCNNWGAIAGMLVSSVGFGILPRGWGDQMIQCSRLVTLSSAETLASLTYSFQWRRGDSRPLLDKMRTIVTEVADFSAASYLPLLH